jgi:hypothetical protein
VTVTTKAPGEIQVSTRVKTKIESVYKFRFWSWLAAGGPHGIGSLIGGVGALVAAFGAFAALLHSDEVLTRLTQVGEITTQTQHTLRNAQKTLIDLQKAVEILQDQTTALVAERGISGSKSLHRTDATKEQIVRDLKTAFNPKPSGAQGVYLPEIKLNELAERLHETSDISERKTIIQNALMMGGH